MSECRGRSAAARWLGYSRRRAAIPSMRSSWRWRFRPARRRHRRLPLPASLDEIVAARLAGIEGEVEEVLLAIAALSEPTLELLERALGPGVARSLDVAEERGVVMLEGGQVRFMHPLLADGVYARATAIRRRSMHLRLSGAVTDPEERARHLAYAGARDAVAALEEAARHVRARGAPDAAAELLELALGLGGAEELRVRAAEHHYDAGDPRRAQALLEQAIEGLPPGDGACGGVVPARRDPLSPRQLPRGAGAARAGAVGGPGERAPARDGRAEAHLHALQPRPSHLQRRVRRDQRSLAPSSSTIVRCWRRRSPPRSWSTSASAWDSMTRSCGVPSSSVTRTRPWGRSSSPR